MSDKHLGCGGCGARLVVVAPEKELSKEVAENGGDIGSRLVFECPNWDDDNPDAHTMIIVDLAKIIETGRILD